MGHTSTTMATVSRHPIRLARLVLLLYVIGMMAYERSKIGEVGEEIFSTARGEDMKYFIPLEGWNLFEEWIFMTYPRQSLRSM